MTLPLAVRRTMEDVRKKQSMSRALKDQEAFIRGVKIGKAFYLSIQGNCPADACESDRGQASITEVPNPLE